MRAHIQHLADISHSVHILCDIIPHLARGCCCVTLTIDRGVRDRVVANNERVNVAYSRYGYSNLQPIVVVHGRSACVQNPISRLEPIPPYRYLHVTSIHPY